MTRKPSRYRWYFDQGQKVSIAFHVAIPKALADKLRAAMQQYMPPPGQVRTVDLALMEELVVMIDRVVVAFEDHEDARSGVRSPDSAERWN